MHGGLYGLFFPLIRMKGHLFKMGNMKLTNYPRYFYLNPIEGKLVSYKTANLFPHKPNYIINLGDITELEFLKTSQWYFNKGNYYFKIVTKDSSEVFFDDNLDVVQFWLN
jgi:hypothetical protein